MNLSSRVPAKEASRFPINEPHDLVTVHQAHVVFLRRRFKSNPKQLISVTT